jgi:hypothetical protein
MQYEIFYELTCSLAEVRPSDVESIQAEISLMAYMSVNV